MKRITIAIIFVLFTFYLCTADEFMKLNNDISIKIEKQNNSLYLIQKRQNNISKQKIKSVKWYLKNSKSEGGKLRNKEINNINEVRITNLKETGKFFIKYLANIEIFWDDNTRSNGNMELYFNGKLYDFYCYLAYSYEDMF